MIYLTGDTHGDFSRIKKFCKCFNTTRDDIMIILGDAGINFNGWFIDRPKKEFISNLPITLFCVHGNHEQRPSLDLYKETTFCNGTVWIEDVYPNIIFAKDGEIYDFNGLSTLVIGGAYSIDKNYRLVMGWPWFPDEQPSEEIKKYVEQQLDRCSWNVDVVLSHTVPRKYEPIETFMKGIDQSKVDKSTEDWLDYIEDRLCYKKWYAGHFHVNKDVDKISMLFEQYRELTSNEHSSVFESGV